MILKIFKNMMGFVFFSIMFSVLFLSGCGNDSSNLETFTNEDHLVMNINEMIDLDITLWDLPVSDFDDGISFGIFPGFENTLDEVCPEGCWGSFALNTPQDVLTASVVNAGLEERSFVLKLFYNYEEISFQLLGSEEVYTEFLFSLNADTEVHIPFQLDDALEISPYYNKLTAVLFMYPEHYVNFTDQDRIDMTSNLIINFELTYGSNNVALPLISTSEEIHRYSTSTTWFGIYMIDYFESVEPIEDISFPPSLIQGSPGETLELSFIANLSSSTSEALESYVILAVLDWQQINLNGNPYMFILVENEKGEDIDYGRFTITLPEEPGFYEFKLIGIPNPTNPNNRENYLPQDYSQRITIEVIR